MRIVKTLLALGLLVLSCIAAHAAPQVGWWWNPNESGRGFFIESHNGTTFFAAYFYDDDGHAKWLVGGGQNADPYNYTGPLYEVSGGQTLFGSYVAPKAPSSVGNVTVHFDDDTHGTWTWPGGVIPIQRQIFGGSGAAFQVRSGWWWNPQESGTGYSIELQGDNLVVAGFMYDDTGRPVWYFSAGPMSSPTTYHGDVLQFANGQTMGGPYQPPTANSKVATVDITFKALDRATVTFTGSPATDTLAKASLERTEEIMREFDDNDFFTPFWTYYGGWATMNFDAEIPMQELVGGISWAGSAQMSLAISDMVWQLNYVNAVHAGESDIGLQTATYVLLSGHFTLTTKGQDIGIFPEIGVVTCTSSQQGTADLRFPFTSSAILKVSNLGSYTLTLSFDQSFIPESGTLQCVGPGGGVLEGYQMPLMPAPPLEASGTGVSAGTMFGTTIADDLPKKINPFPFNGTLTITGDYDFNGTSDCDEVDACQ